MKLISLPKSSAVTCAREASGRLSPRENAAANTDREAAETVKLCWGRANAEVLIRRVSSPTLLKLRFAARTLAKKTSPPLPASVHELSLAHPGRAA